MFIKTQLIQKSREKKSIRFDNVREFRFNRIQSFVTMPSYGGYSLGMGKIRLKSQTLTFVSCRQDALQWPRALPGQVSS